MTSQKISSFNVSTSLTDSDLFTFVLNGTNKNVKFSDFKLALGVTGTLTAIGDPLAVQVLSEPSPSDYQIRAIESGNGILASVSPENGVKLKWNVSQDSNGVAITSGLTNAQPVISSLSAGLGISIVKSGDEIVITAVAGGGAGTGQGFIDYNDTSTASSPLVLTGGVWTTIPNDGLGVASNDTYRPVGVTELMNVSTGDIDPTELDLGDTLLVRNDYQVTPGTNNTLLEFRYSLGTGGNVYTLEKIIGRLDSGSGQPYRFSLSTDLIYMGDLNTKDNPIILQVKLSASGTLINAGSAIQVIKK